MVHEDNSKGDSFKKFIGGVIKSRIDNLGDAVKQSVVDAQNNVNATVRTGFGLLKDENTSHLTTQLDAEVPVYETVAVNEGKNARVRLWPDRLEWEKGRGISSAKVITGLFTGGASLLVTGIRGSKDAFEALPLSAITNISLNKAGRSHQLVSVQTAGGAIDFEVSRYNAADFRLAILTQIQTNAATPTKVELVNPPVSTPSLNVDFAEKLQKLAELRDMGVITNTEFEQKKTQILSGL